MEKITIDINIELVSNNFLNYLKLITESSTYIYYSVINSSFDNSRPLPTDNFPLRINDFKPYTSITEIKETSINWIFTKAIEDLIKGLTLSLIEGYKYVNIKELSLLRPAAQNKEELYIKINEINNKAHREPFPKLIDYIEKGLDVKLELKEEIISINKLRNCLVHGNGYVLQKYINKEDFLDLKWIELGCYTIQDNKRMKIDYKLREKSYKTNNLEFVESLKLKQFKLNEKIEININLFNDLSYTCSQFAKKLFLNFQNNN